MFVHVCLTHYRLLELGGLVDVEELASTQCKDHALVVFLQLIVHLCGHESSKLPLGEGVIFVERLTMTQIC